MSRQTPVIGTDAPDWDAAWQDADLPAAERGVWREVLSYRTNVPDDAVILARRGWRPADVIAATDDPGVYWPDRGAVRVREERPEDRTAALAVLANETAKYHESRANLARELRAQYIADLAERPPKDERWSHEKVAGLLGLTRQRVRMILKRKAV